MYFLAHCHLSIFEKFYYYYLVLLPDRIWSRVRTDLEGRIQILNIIK
jgi:hypothetical protein